MMVSFIGIDRGVGPICAQVLTAPSTYYEHRGVKRGWSVGRRGCVVTGSGAERFAGCTTDISKGTEYARFGASARGQRVKTLCAWYRPTVSTLG